MSDKQKRIEEIAETLRNCEEYDTYYITTDGEERIVFDAEIRPEYYKLAAEFFTLLDEVYGEKK